MNNFKSFFFITIVFIFATVVFSAPITLGSFTTGTVITFDSIPNEQLITNQYSANGVTFSGSIYGLIHSGDFAQFTNPGTALASNWKYSTGKTGDSFTATFTSSFTKVGFWSETNPGDNVMVELFQDSISRGSLTFVNSNGLPADFIGLQETLGFNKVVVTVVGTANHFLAINDFRFDAQAIPVPEPSVFMLVIGSLFWCVYLSYMNKFSK